MKFHLISRALLGKRKLSVATLCQFAGVSRSGFYRWAAAPVKKRGKIENLIVKIFHEKKKKAGYRTIKMLLLRKYNLQANHKKIRRVMKAEGLCTEIRRRKKFNTFNEKSRSANPHPNLVDQKFDPAFPDQIYSADITQIYYGRCRKAFVYAVKDLCAKDIVSFEVSGHPDANLVTRNYREHLSKLPDKKRRELVSHTDQGGQFLSDSYCATLNNLGVKMSMSRKGNCLDNSPIESFFGHMKDEVSFKTCKDLVDVKRIVTRYMNEYNNQRPQWGLKGKTPAECRSQFK